LVVIGTACRQSVRYLAESGLDDLLVLRDRLVLLKLGKDEMRPIRARTEDRQRDLRCERPVGRSGLEQPGKREAFGARLSGQRDPGKECGARGADVGVGAAQYLFGLEDVRAPCQQIRRQSGRDIGRQILLPQR